MEDIELVESLEETKKTATSVTEQVKAARESEVSQSMRKATQMYTGNQKVGSRTD